MSDFRILFNNRPDVLKRLAAVYFSHPTEKQLGEMEQLVAHFSGMDRFIGIVAEDETYRAAVQVRQMEDDRWEMTGLQTEEAHRRQGHGRRLVESLQQVLRPMGARTLEAHVPADNQAALALFQACGFTCQPEGEICHCVFVLS